MSFQVMKCYEYIAECDICGVIEIMHTGDAVSVGGKEIRVHDTHSAIKGFNFHNTKHGFICNECFKEIKQIGEKKENDA